MPAGRRSPLTARLDPARPDHADIVAAHERAIARGEDTYRDPATGYVVFTAQAHWDRGSCCRSGCRHCPYERGPRAGVPRDEPGPRADVPQDEPGTE